MAFFIALAPKSHAGKVLRQQELIINIDGHDVGNTIIEDKRTQGGFSHLRATNITLQRGEIRGTMNTHLIAESAEDGAPISFRFSKTDNTGKLEREGKRQGNTLFVKTSHAGHTFSEHIPINDKTRLSAGSELMIHLHLEKQKNFELPVYIEEMGAKTMVKGSVKKSNEGYEVTSTMMGLKTIDRLDFRGRILESRSPSIRLLAYPKGQHPGGLRKSETLNITTYTSWPAPSLATNPKWVRFRVFIPDEVTLTIPQDHRQKVLVRKAGQVDIEVRPLLASEMKLSKKLRKKLTSATLYEATREPRMIDTAKKANGDAKTSWDKTAALVDFVHGFILHKSLDQAYAPALVTLRSRKGDCTEHSVLLSALLRSLGIPTRLADGVIVSGEKISYHEWVEVYIDGQGFVPADPTFNTFPAEANRLKLAEGTTAPEDFLAMGTVAAKLFSGVRISVVGAEPSPF